MKIPAGGMREEGGGISLMDHKKENVSDNCCDKDNYDRCSHIVTYQLSLCVARSTKRTDNGSLFCYRVARCNSEYE